MTASRSLRTASAVLAAALALTGCAAGSQQMPMGGMYSGSSSSAEANRNDVMFAQMMIPHHEQAVEMSDMLLGKTGISAGTVAIAAQIKAAQTPEIEQLKQMLDDWGYTSGGSMGGTGMMGGDDMGDLAAANGAEAERIFLTQMIDHHEGAIAMSEPEIENGVSADAVALAIDIVEAQKIEIEQMTQLLEAL